MTLHATSVKCPECNAVLVVPEGATSATCQYCGTSSRVQRRTQFLQRRVELPAPQPHEPARVARQPRNTTGKLVLGVIILASVGAPLVVVGALIAGTLGAFDGHDWSSSRAALAVDVDGDGDQDFVGYDRNVHADTMRVAAFSGSDGHVIWETDSLGTYTAVYRAPIVVGAGLAVVGVETNVIAFDAKTGARRWQVSASEVVDQACRDDASHVRIITKDHVAWLAAATDGTLARDTGTCSHPSDAPRIDVPGMSMPEALRDAAGAVVFGTKSPGSAIPMVAAVDPKGAVTWTAPVPGHDPLHARSDDVRAISANDVAVAYARDSHDILEVTVFDRATGTRRWEKPLGKTLMSVLSGVTITQRSVAVATWGSLQVFDLATGDRRFVIGG